MQCKYTHVYVLARVSGLVYVHIRALLGMRVVGEGLVSDECPLTSKLSARMLIVSEWTRETQLFTQSVYSFMET